METNNAIYEAVTARIIEQLEKGVIPWRKDWSDACVSYTTRKGYRGVNAMVLDRPGEYITFNQVKELGGSVKKGAKSYPIVWYKPYTYEAGTPDERTVMLPARYYRVFHLDDTEGIPSKLDSARAPIATSDDADKIVDDYADRTELKIQHVEQNRAYYTPSVDAVTMPTREQFNNTAGYYGALFHELTHSTGHSKRLSRSGITEHNRFGSSEYGKEELVAEIGSAMLYSLIGLGAQPEIENSAAYIKSWLGAIRSDSKLITSAANAAQKAADFILGVQYAEA